MIIENGSFKVYAHINKINGKLYVGITKRPVNERWKNGHGYSESVLFYNAIKKYGWDNFDHEIIADNLTEEEATNMEELLIRKLNLQNDKYGYNIRYGGTNCSLSEETKEKIGNALRGRKYSEEKRKAISERQKGKKLSQKQIEAIRRSRSKIVRTEEWTNKLIAGLREKCTGENHWTRRLGITDETKTKISDSVKSYYAEDGHKHIPTNKKKILQVETNIVYDSIEDAAKAVNACRSQISEAAAGTNGHKTAKGYHWKFI